MREIHVDEITKTVRDLAIRANTELGQDVLDAFKRAVETETSPIGRDILQRLIENAGIANKEKIPMCQDTGMAIVFVEIGQDVHIVGGALKDAVDEGVRRGRTTERRKRLARGIGVRSGREGRSGPI